MPHHNVVIAVIIWYIFELYDLLQSKRMRGLKKINVYNRASGLSALPQKRIHKWSSSKLIIFV